MFYGLFKFGSGMGWWWDMKTDWCHWLKQTHLLLLSSQWWPLLPERSRKNTFVSNKQLIKLVRRSVLHFSLWFAHMFFCFSTCKRDWLNRKEHEVNMEPWRRLDLEVLEAGCGFITTWNHLYTVHHSSKMNKLHTQLGCYCCSFVLSDFLFACTHCIISETVVGSVSECFCHV